MNSDHLLSLVWQMLANVDDERARFDATPSPRLRVGVERFEPARWFPG
jgi:hypothetical protein